MYTVTNTGFLQDGDVGIGVFPEGEEVLILDVTAGSSRGAARLETVVQLAGGPGVATLSNKTVLGLVLHRLTPRR